MKFKLSKIQIIILIISVIVGGYLGYLFIPLVECPIGMDCSVNPIPYLLGGMLIFGLITYIIEILYNNLKKG